MRNRAKRAVRDTVIPVVSRTPMVQRRAARKLSQLSVAYPQSPLVQPSRNGRRPKPGDRFPDVEVRTEHGPARLHHLLGSGRHVLIVSGAGVHSALETAGVGRYAELVDVVTRPCVVTGDQFRRQDNGTPCGVRLRTEVPAP